MLDTKLLIDAGHGDGSVIVAALNAVAMLPEIAHDEEITAPQMMPNGPPDENGDPTLIEVQVPTGETRRVVDQAAETEAAFVARMAGALVPQGMQWRSVAATDLPAAPDDRLRVNWTTGAISVAGVPQDELRAAAADKRWRVETGGFFDGAGRHIATDRDSQTKLLAEMVAIGAGLRDDPSGWKLMGNGFVMLSNAEMQGVIAAARDHVTSAFAREGLMQAEIASGLVTTLGHVEDPTSAGLTPWPSN